MGYYDDEGAFHSFREGSYKMAGGHHHHGMPRPGPGDSAEAYIPNTVVVPTNHVRLGDTLILQGRPCSVIKISESSATGQTRYLGVDVFTKQLHEDSSLTSNPAPSVFVHTVLAPVTKQYRVLDVQEGRVTCMTETGDVKPDVPVSEQSNLSHRIKQAFNSGRGSVRVLVLSDGGVDLVVDVKTLHGSNL